MGEAARRGRLMRVAREAAIETALGDLHDYMTVLECEACGAARGRMESVACIGKEAEMLLIGDDSRQKPCPVSGKHIHLRCVCRHVMIERWKSDKENAPLLGEPLEQGDSTVDAMDLLAILCGDSAGGLVIPALSVEKMRAGWYGAIEVVRAESGAILLRRLEAPEPPTDVEGSGEDVPGPDVISTSSS